jgi:hypothetical protein
VVDPFLGNIDLLDLDPRTQLNPNPVVEPDLKHCR